MPNTTLPRLTTSYGSVDAINSALAQIEAALSDTLSRSGVVPNQMTGDLDLNGRRIVNLPRPSTPKEPVTLEALQDMSTIVLYEPNPHTHDWTNDITGKPATFLPSAHTHSILDITGLTATLAALQNSINVLNAQPLVNVQPTQPPPGQVNDLWFY